VKELVASQIEGLSPSDLPDNLEQLACFEKEKIGINIEGEAHKFCAGNGVG
jgi:hypothetical protein